MPWLGMPWCSLDTASCISAGLCRCDVSFDAAPPPLPPPLRAAAVVCVPPLSATDDPDPARAEDAPWCTAELGLDVEAPCAVCDRAPVLPACGACG